MRQWQSWLAAGLVALVWGAGEAAAQFRYIQPQTNYYGRPTTSPYLSLGAFGTGGNLNYFSIARPGQQTAQSVGALQQTVQQQQSELNQLQTAPGQAQPLVGTGHRTYFGSYQNYFPPSVRPPINGFGGGYSPAIGGAFSTPLLGVGQSNPSISVFRRF